MVKIIEPRVKRNAQTRIYLIEIFLEQTQRFISDKQGLLTSKPSQSTLDVVKKIHDIQIDTISVVIKSHDLSVFHRFPRCQGEYMETS